jgi:peptide deformylase
MKLKLRLDNDPALRKVSVRIDKIDRRISELAHLMMYYMKKWGGVGLSAPQVGRNIRLIVIDTSKYSFGTKLIMVNPEVVSQDSVCSLRDEGCLSFPGKVVERARPNSITVRWTSLFNVHRESVFYGLTAQVILHEIEHLDGILLTDPLTPPGEVAPRPIMHVMHEPKAAEKKPEMSTEDLLAIVQSDKES